MHVYVLVHEDSVLIISKSVHFQMSIIPFSTKLYHCVNYWMKMSFNKVRKHRANDADSKLVCQPLLRMHVWSILYLKLNVLIPYAFHLEPVQLTAISLVTALLVNHFWFPYKSSDHGTAIYQTCEFVRHQELCILMSKTFLKRIWLHRPAIFRLGRLHQVMTIRFWRQYARKLVHKSANKVKIIKNLLKI